jgi:hypothetical protein
MNIYFSDYFRVKERDLENYGAFNISLIADLPLFIDPFLLFNSKKKTYRKLHKDIIKYLMFLKTKSETQDLDIGALKAWYIFKEVDQNWLGFSISGNKGNGLGSDFGKALHKNLHNIFHDFGQEKQMAITRGSHLEKLCLIKERVGKDKISDFATNLIKEYLLNYTQAFTLKYINPKLRGKIRVPRTCFNYETETWQEGLFDLPKLNNDFVILTPKDLITKDETWINKKDMYEDYDNIADAVTDSELRFRINNYFIKLLAQDKKKKKAPTKKERNAAIYATIQEYPQLIDYYIKYKEDNGDTAENISNQKVSLSQFIYIENVKQFRAGLENTSFYLPAKNSYAEAKKKIALLKEYIENNDGYRLFYHNGHVSLDEDDLQLLFGLVCHGSTAFDVNREVNNGRGAVDFKISRGSADKTLVEFKLASNRKLERNLQKQVEVYQKANKTMSSFKVIIYFTETEYKRVMMILNRIGLAGKENVILIDGRKDNKPSASNA